MRLDVSIPRSSLDRLRMLLHPSRQKAFLAALALTFLALLIDRHSPSVFLKGAQVFFLLSGLTLAWLELGIQNQGAASGMQYLLFAVTLTAVLQNWWRTPAFDFGYLHVAIVAVAAVVCKPRSAAVIAGTVILLELVFLPGRGGGVVEIVVRVGSKAALLLATVMIISGASNRLRHRVLLLGEELQRVRSTHFAFSPAEQGSSQAAEDSDLSETELVTLEQSVDSILRRIKEYFRAYSVLLFQPGGEESLTLRHWVSDSPDLLPGANLHNTHSLLGRIFTRGVSCRWNLDDPQSQVKFDDLAHYSRWQPVRHVAASPLKSNDVPSGLLVVERTAANPFNELELIHLETFAIQVVEMIAMGRRYLEQVDRNAEYRLFYRAMADLGRSLATQDVLEVLAEVCQRVVPVSHILISLLDEGGRFYEIAFAKGAEKLRGSRVPCQGRTWISWALNSDADSLILKDIRSHSSRLPVASPHEGELTVRSVLLIPLKVKGRTLGLLLLGSDQADYFKHEHMHMLSTICLQAAANIENSLLHRRVEDEALSDGLTHLHNHRYFQERLQAEVSRARRNNGAISLLMADIDHFKKINDTFGHRIGDSVLLQIAAILKDTVRSADDVARYGGEEFAIILPDSDRKGALRMSERARQAVERVTFVAEEHRIQITISIGSATFPNDAGEPWVLIEHADRALYAAKEQGRNRVVQYHTLVINPAPSGKVMP